MCDILQVQLTPTLTSPARKRWLWAFKILYSARALLSTAKKIVAENKNEILRNFSRSKSYTTVEIEPLSFSSISKPILAKFVRARDVKQLGQLGGMEGLLSVLEADAEKGIVGDVKDIASRREHFGTNTFKKPSINLLQILLKSLKDPNIIIVLLYAVLSLSFGIKRHGLKGCLDGGIILVSLFLAISLSAFCNYWHKQQLYELCRPIETAPILVIRDGKDTRISLSEAVVGDVIRLKAGDQVPTDGIYIGQQSLQIDESTITRKNDLVEVNSSNSNLFLLSGSKVLKGHGRMLVTAVGMNTALAEIISPTCFNHDHKSLLQKKLHKLTSHIAMVGLAVSFLVLSVLLVRYFTGNMRNNGIKLFIGGKTSIQDVWKAFLGILATPVAIASGAIPEGLTLACALAIAYSTKKMFADQAIVRSLSACEAMASATVICTDKEGILTENSLQVSQFWLGQEYIGKGTFSSLAPEILDLLHEGMALNTIPPGSSFEHIEDQIQDAILAWGIKSMNMDVQQLRTRCTVVHAESSDLAYNGRVLIRRNADSKVHVHHKGTPEAILAMCSGYYEETGDIKDINDDARAALQRRITRMKMDGLQCVGFAYRSVTAEHQIDHEGGHLHPKLKEVDSILLAFVGLKALCREQARKAVMDCQDAGVNIKIITKDDIHTARASAVDYGIIDPNHDISTGEVIEGKTFQKYAEDERLEKVENIRVIARASTLDKLLMIRCLQKKGHVVAVTGDRVGDAEVLREANVGLSLGNQGTDTARDSSDIVIMDDNFASIARVLSWGRTTYNNVQIFTQYQLTATITSLVMDFVTAISASEPVTINIVTVISTGNIRYAMLQVLWVKLMVGTLAALALTIDGPGTKLMQQPPTDPNEPFITNIMWKNIAGQALYLISVLLTIQFTGESGYQLSDKEKDTMIFNIFVLYQLFSIFNLRKYEGGLLKELKTKRLFWGIAGMIVIIQVAMVEILKEFAYTERLNWQQWQVSIGLAALSWPVSWLINCIPVPKKPLFSCRNRQNFSYSTFGSSARL
ncbi:unnamed protein product [Withania somnifera]